jgi:hypothetical protein
LTKKWETTKLPYEKPTKQERLKAYGLYLCDWLFTTGGPIDYEIARDLGNGGRIYKNGYIPFDYDEENLAYKEEDYQYDK